MSRSVKRGVATLAALALVGAVGVGITVLVIAPPSGAAGAQALFDVGRFRVGSQLGEERAGFAGRAKVQVFTNASAQDWPAIASCLQSAAVGEEMEFFTGVLVDETAEQNVEPILRERDQLRVIVRSLEGAFLDGLKEVNAADLAAPLKVIAERLGKPSEPSPACARLRESREPIDLLLARMVKKPPPAPRW